MTAKHVLIRIEHLLLLLDEAGITRQDIESDLVQQARSK